MPDDSTPTEIRLVFTGRPAITYPLRGAVLVELPRAYDGARPLRDGRLVGELRVTTHRLDEPVSDRGDSASRTNGSYHPSDSRSASFEIVLAEPETVLTAVGVDGRVLSPDYPCDREPLAFRAIHHRPRSYGFHPLDDDVASCERCSGGGRLNRDYDDDLLPALCAECFLEQTGRETVCCEEWCYLDLDHDGLCAPE
jgi:hypothetical protein